MKSLLRRIRKSAVVMITVMAATAVIAPPVMVIALEREFINWPIYAGMVAGMVWLTLFYYSNVLWRRK